MNPHQWKNVINQNRDGLEKILMAFFQQNENDCPFPHVSPNKVRSDDQMAKCIH